MPPIGPATGPDQRKKRLKRIPQLANTITAARIALAPVLILLLKSEDYLHALVVFLIAGISDMLDGLVAKRFNQITRVGAILDPAADKILLVSAYVMLTYLGQIPFWLMLTVAFRDLLIVGGYLLYTSLVRSVQMRPSHLSKLNTFMQIALVVAILAQQAGLMPLAALVQGLIYVVFATTLSSGLHYLWVWIVMKEIEPAERFRE